MTIEAMARLVAANPVSELPVVESAERLRCLIEDDVPAMDLGERREARSPIRRRGIAILLATATSVAGVLLTAGSSAPGVNVAAAAYAATSSGSGIVEAVFIARVFRGSEAGGTLRQREWRDSSAGLRREQYTTTGPYGDTRETHVLEMAFAPGRWETWSSAPEANVITRTMIPTAGPTGTSIAFDGIALDGVEGVELYRKLYREGLMRLVGSERHKGRSLWKLESRRIGFPTTDHARLIVLVDPKTFLPIVERQIDVALPGDLTVVESNLLSYRRLGRAGSDAELFDLTAQHPDARLLRRTTHPRFLSRRR